MRKEILSLPESPKGDYRAIHNAADSHDGLPYNPLTRIGLRRPSVRVMTNKSAFTLVELSIVLVILGLLVGGVLAGQNLIRAAELRSVTTEFTQWQTAVMTFKEKYFALPGDMNNATAFWGAAASGPACYTSAATGTCDGNSDGILERSVTTSTNHTNEWFRFWQHLALAGLVEGAYTGAADSGSTYDATAGVNVPISKISSGTWHISSIVTPTSGHSKYYDDTYRTHFMFGGERVGLPEVQIFTAEELWNIDTKIDDGMPATGMAMSFNNTGWNNVGGTLNRCTLSASGADKGKNYDLDGDGLQCVAIFKVKF